MWVAGIILLLLLWMVFIRRDYRPDESVFAITGRWITPDRTAILKAVTFLGNHKFLIPANLFLIGFLLYRKKKKLALTVLIVALSSLLLKIGLKELFQRPRPASPLVDGITNYSFPSGHALMGIALYGLLIWMIRQQPGERWRRNGLIIFLVLLILVIGFSRIYLRVHYATDVIAGYCIGILWLWCCLRLTSKLRGIGLVPEQ